MTSRMTVRPTYLLAQIATCIALLLLVGACKKDSGNGIEKERLPADPENYLPILQVPSPGPVTHALPAPGHLLITGDRTGALRLENANGDLVRPLPGHTAAIAYLGLAAPTSGPPLVVSVDEKSNVVVSEIPGGEEKDRFNLGFLFNDIDISPDGSYLAVTDTSGRRVTLLPLANKTRFSRFQKGERVRWTPDGGHVVIGGTDLSFLEAKTWKPRQTLRLGGKPLVEFVFSPDGSIVYSLDTASRLAAHQVEGGKLIFEKTLAAGAPGGLTLSASGAMLVVCDSPTSVVLLSSRTGDERVRHESPFPLDSGSLVYSAGHAFAHEAVAGDPAPGGSGVPTAGGDRPSRRWSSSSGESKAVLPPVTTCIAPAPEGGLAIGMSDGRLGLWPVGGGPDVFRGP